MKTIWIDVLHIPQLNFYIPLIKMLSGQGHKVLVTVLGRGKLPVIARKELSGMAGVSVTTFGRHRMKKWSILVEANALRLLQLLIWIPGKNIDVAFSNGCHVGIMGHIFGFPAYEFDDDPQTRDYSLMCRFATEERSLLFELPDGFKLNRRGKVLPVLKEWAYLNPREFKPSVNALEKYGLRPKEYIFLREVSVGTFNYADQAQQAILAVAQLIDDARCKDGVTVDNPSTCSGQVAQCTIKVLFSLEEKNRRGEYPEDWILLQEPVEDIHSLMYYAAGLVSSGDSMAREAALLGIPSYYLGIRHSMPANLAASKVANLQNEKTMPFEEWINGLMNDEMMNDEMMNDEMMNDEMMNDGLMEKQKKVREHIDQEFIDINEYMYTLIKNS